MLIGGRIDVVVCPHIVFSMIAFSELCAREDHNSSVVALFLSLLDECRIHVGGLIDFALSRRDEVQVCRSIGACGNFRTRPIRIFSRNCVVLHSNVDLLSCRGCTPESCELGIACFFCCVSINAVVCRSASFATNSCLQVLERGAYRCFATCCNVEVSRVIRRWDFIAHLLCHVHHSSSIARAIIDSY